MQKRWDEDEHSSRRSNSCGPEELRSFSFLARKAIFEAKAGQRDQADHYEREAAALLPELGAFVAGNARRVRPVQID